MTIARLSQGVCTLALAGCFSAAPPPPTPLQSDSIAKALFELAVVPCSITGVWPFDSRYKAVATAGRQYGTRTPVTIKRETDSTYGIERVVLNKISAHVYRLHTDSRVVPLTLTGERLNGKYTIEGFFPHGVSGTLSQDRRRCSLAVTALFEISLDFSLR